MLNLNKKIKYNKLPLFQNFFKIVSDVGNGYYLPMISVEEQPRDIYAPLRCFTDAKNIFNHLTLRDSEYVVNVELPSDDSTEIICENNRYYTNNLTLGTKRSLCNLETIKYLIRSGADISINNYHVLCWSMAKKYFDIVKYLINSGADIKANDNYLLRTTISTSNLSMLEYLIKKGIDVQYNNNFPIYLAASLGFTDIVERLVKEGADFRANNDEPLKMALEHGHYDMVVYLINLGINVQINDEYPLRAATKYQHKSIIDFLITKGAGLDRALCFAIINNETTTIRHLVEYGANVQFDNNEPIMIATKQGNLDLVGYLVENGADINADKDRIIECANAYTRPEILSYLVKLIK